MKIYYWSIIGRQGQSIQLRPKTFEHLKLLKKWNFQINLAEVVQELFRTILKTLESCYSAEKFSPSETRWWPWHKDVTNNSTNNVTYFHFDVRWKYHINSILRLTTLNYASSLCTSTLMVPLAKNFLKCRAA
jgi:hypothetical protein